jgi:RNA-directed DNA polymerase
LGREGETSEYPIVPVKPGQSPQATRWRAGGSGKTALGAGKMAGTPRPTTVSTTLHTIETRAREAPECVCTTLAQHLALDLLREAYRRTRKDGATGVDGQTAEDSAENLERTLPSLLNRLKAGTSVAPPVKRAYGPKDAGGASRPIGLPPFAAKVLQRAVTIILEAVYAQDCLDCSSGFRPGRSAQQALAALGGQVRRMHGGGLIKVDMQSYGDTGTIAICDAVWTNGDAPA